LLKNDVLAVEGGQEFLDEAVAVAKAEAVRSGLNDECDAEFIVADNFQMLGQPYGPREQFVHIDLGNGNIQVFKTSLNITESHRPPFCSTLHHFPPRRACVSNQYCLFFYRLFLTRPVLM